jgi:hypothetical protein
LQKFRELTGGEKVLLLQAAAWLIWIRLLLFIFPFRHVKTLVHRWSKPRRARFPTHRLAYLINAAANRIPRTHCLPRALVAQVLLCRHGQPAELHIGVARDSNGKFEAHAWIESAGQVVIGGSAVGRYSRLLSGTTGPPEGPSNEETNRLKDQGSKGPSRPLVPFS